MLAAFVIRMVYKSFIGDDKVHDMSDRRSKGKHTEGLFKLKKRSAKILDNFVMSLMGHILKLFFGPKHIRNRNVTYAALSHHTTSHRDTQSLCWQCDNDLDLQLCRLDLTIDYYHCNHLDAKHTTHENEPILNEKPGRTQSNVFISYCG